MRLASSEGEYHPRRISLPRSMSSSAGCRSREMRLAEDRMRGVSCLTDYCPMSGKRPDPAACHGMTPRHSLTPRHSRHFWPQGLSPLCGLRLTPIACLPGAISALTISIVPKYT